jgi:outer membrane protein
MKNYLTIIACLGLILISPSISSQDMLKIGHVNTNEIFMSLPESDSAQTLLQKETAELELMLEEMQVNLNNLVNAYEKEQATYSDIVKKTKETEIIDIQRRIQEFQQDANQRMQQRNLELIQPIYDKIYKAIEKIATEKGFTYILDISKGSVVFASKNSQNINPIVLHELGIEK